MAMGTCLLSQGAVVPSSSVPSVKSAITFQFGAKHMGHHTYTFVDLFSGAGGFTEGILLAGGLDRRFRLLLASDIHDNAQRTHENRFKSQLKLDYCFLRKDIRERNFVSEIFKRLGSSADSVDLVIGGPPCQGFSVFGPRQQADPRNDLFRPYLKAISALQPKYFVMENVPGLTMMYGGAAVREIYQAVESMRKPRYHLAGPLRVNAASFGVPQTRDRVLFIGSRSDVPVLDVLATTTGRHLTAKDALDDLAFLRAWESNGRYHESHPPITQYQIDSRRGRLFGAWGLDRSDTSLTNHDAACHTPDVIARFAMMEPGTGFESIPSPLWEGYLKSSKKWCVRLSADKPAYTVTTLPDDFVHYRQHRILTVREWARLQSFDDTFTFLGPRASGGGGKGNKKRQIELPQYTQVGNAVPPLLAAGIGASILMALDSSVPTRKTRRDDFLSQIH
jgi:DNA (cytosine-5)-methyltransferase 1